MQRDPAKWTGYGLRPLDIAPTTDSVFCGQLGPALDENLDDEDAQLDKSTQALLMQLQKNAADKEIPEQEDTSQNNSQDKSGGTGERHRGAEGPPQATERMTFLASQLALAVLPASSDWRSVATSAFLADSSPEVAASFAAVAASSSLALE